MLQIRTGICKGSSCERIEEIGLSRWSNFSGVKECLDQDAEKGRDTTSRGENDKDYEAGGREEMEEMMYRSRQVNTNAFLKGVGSLYPTMDKLQLRNVPEPSAYLSVLKSIQINPPPHPS